MDAVAQLVEKRHKRWGLFFAFLGWRILLMIKKERVVKERAPQCNNPPFLAQENLLDLRQLGLGLPVMEKTERF